jgi:hypothetical protein
METTTATYYTPQLEELYGVSEFYGNSPSATEEEPEIVKFEIHPFNWPSILTVKTLPSGKVEYSVPGNNQILFKYLDKADIESLDFKIYDIGNGTMRFMNSGIKITLYPDKKMISISVCVNKIKDEWIVPFSGLCKNIHELKQIFKYVGIIGIK